VNEILGVRLVTLHNLHMYLEFMKEMRSAILDGEFGAFRRSRLEAYATIQQEHAERVREN
jgi:queuine tRNA-ribosyltransferase